MKKSHAVFMFAAMAALLSVGCQSGPPEGSTGGRIDPYRTTAADRMSGAASVPALLEFSDQTAAALARDICAIPELATVRGKPVLELGGINNQTGTPTTDFEMMQRRVRGHLLSSTLVRNTFTIVADPQRMDHEMGRISGQDAGSARYDPAQTFVLLGDFYEARRGNTRRYYFSFELTNLASRQTVFHKDYDLGQQ